MEENHAGSDIGTGTDARMDTQINGQMDTHTDTQKGNQANSQMDTKADILEDIHTNIQIDDSPGVDLKKPEGNAVPGSQKPEGGAASDPQSTGHPGQADNGHGSQEPLSAYEYGPEDINSAYTYGQPESQQEPGVSQPDGYNGNVSSPYSGSGTQYGQGNGSMPYSGNPGGSTQYGQGNNRYAQYNGNPGSGYAQYNQYQKPGNGFGIASMILGILSLALFCTCINIPLAIAAIVLGVVHLTRNPQGRAFGIAGIVTAVLSVVAFIVMVLVLWTPLQNFYWDEIMDQDIQEYAPYSGYDDDDFYNDFDFPFFSEDYHHHSNPRGF